MKYLIILLMCSCTHYYVAPAKIEFKGGTPKIIITGAKTLLRDTIFTGYIIFKR